MPIKQDNNAQTSICERFATCFSTQDQEILRLAADLSGNGVNQFVVQSALRAAQDVIEHANVIRVFRLTSAQSHHFFSRLDAPAKPNKALRHAMDRFRDEKIGSRNSVSGSNG